MCFSIFYREKTVKCFSCKRKLRIVKQNIIMPVGMFAYLQSNQEEIKQLSICLKCYMKIHNNLFID